MKYVIHYFTHKLCIGDKNQALAIIKSITALQGIAAFEHDVQDFSKVALAINQGASLFHIVIAIKGCGSKAIKNLHPLLQNKNFYIAWTGWRLPPGLSDIFNIAHLIALPNSAPGLMKIKQEYPGKLIATLGFAHNLDKQKLQQELQQWQQPIPEAKQYIGVFLGGDNSDEYKFSYLEAMD